MRDFSISAQGSTTYMIVNLRSDDALDQLATGMMNNNEIPGFLPFGTRRINRDMMLYYNVTSLTPLEKGYSALSTEKKMLTFLRSLCAAYMECGEYLLDPRMLWLNPSTVYIQAATGKAFVPYLPLNTEDSVGMQELIKNVMQHTNNYFSNSSAVFHALYQNLFLNTDFSVAALDAQLEELQNNMQKPDVLRGPEKTVEPKVPTPAKAAEITLNKAVPDSKTADKPAEKKPFSLPKSAKKEAGPAIANPFSSQKAEVKQPDEEPVSDFDSIAQESRGKGSFLGGLFGSSKKTPKAEKPAKQTKDKGGLGISIPSFGKADEEEAVETPDNPFSDNAPRSSAPAASSSARGSVIPEPKQTPGAGYTTSLAGDQNGSYTLTSLMGGDDVTNGELWLVRKKTGERVQITHTNFHIGRGHGIVDYAVNTNTDYLGTDHAYINVNDGCFTLVDNNTKNHTWLNGMRLEPSTEYPIKPGDEIRMADEFFSVQ